MISLHTLQLLSDNGFGTIDTDLFWEKLPLGKKGIAIYSRGGAVSYGNRTLRQNFDLYSRGESDLIGAHVLEKVMEFFAEEYMFCELPVTHRSHKKYKNVRIVPTSNVENLGADANDVLIWRLSGQLIYKKD